MFTEINLFHALSVVFKIKFIYFTNKGTMPYIKLRSGKFKLTFSYISFLLYLYNIYLLPFVSLHANSGQLISVEVVSFFYFSMISELI